MIGLREEPLPEADHHVEDPQPGDTVVFFFAMTGCDDPGFYGWAVVEQWHSEEATIWFRPTAPSDHLKMHPWWDGSEGRVMEIVRRVRRGMNQGTLWRVDDPDALLIRQGITRWIAGHGQAG